MLRWTMYSDECLRVVETKKEFTSDALLVQLVKLRLISEKMFDVSRSCSMAEVDSLKGPPAMFYLKSLEAQLNDFKSKIPLELKDNGKLFPNLI